MDTPPFDAAAEAARFCAAAAALTEYRREEALSDAQTEYWRDEPNLDELDNPIRAALWAAYLDAGGTLAELYGVAS